MDGNELAAHGASYNLTDFEKTVLRMCQKVKEDLSKNWLPKIQTILSAVRIKRYQLSKIVCLLNTLVMCLGV